MQPINLFKAISKSRVTRINLKILVYLASCRDMAGKRQRALNFAEGGLKYFFNNFNINPSGDFQNV